MAITQHPLASDYHGDTLTPTQRSERMGRVRGQDTKPEMAVRRLLHSLGYRYRLHAAELPGKPDIVFRKRRKVIFVHGCFWHRHEGCARNRTPKSRHDFWIPKLDGNQQRDVRNQAALRDARWRVLVIWECEAERTDLLREKLIEFLEA